MFNASIRFYESEKTWLRYAMTMTSNIPFGKVELSPQDVKFYFSFFTISKIGSFSRGRKLPFLAFLLRFKILNHLLQGVTLPFSFSVVTFSSESQRGGRAYQKPSSSTKTFFDIASFLRLSFSFSDI
jgi:hypothetical protein